MTPLESISRCVLGELQSIFFDKLISLALFGSQARGDHRSHSDIDFLVVVKNDATDDEIQRSKRALRECDKRVHPNIFKENQLADASVFVILQDIKDGGKILHDMNNCLRNRIDELPPVPIFR